METSHSKNKELFIDLAIISALILPRLKRGIVAKETAVFWKALSRAGQTINWKLAGRLGSLRLESLR